MAKIKTKQAINWGGWNPFILNKVQIEMIEKSKTDSSVTFQIIDTVLEEVTETDELQNEFTFEKELIQIRKRFFTVTKEQYNQLYAGAEAYINATASELTYFEREKVRPAIALLLFVQSDKITDENNNEFCLYGTQPNDWETV